MDGTTTIKTALAAALGLLAAGGAIGPALAEDAAGLTAPAVSAPNQPVIEAPRFVPSAEPEADLLAAPVADPLEDEAAIAEEMPDGLASWYGPGFAGKRTASGERFDPTEYTAAHRTLPFGSRVLVKHKGRSVVVRINDRGPFHGNRVIDLSQAAAEEIGIRRAGHGRVELALLQS